ncbi:MAG: glycosyltransferase family 2 protein [Sphingobacterium composti]|uniref:glycosyltransferase family 2 protein n=1 Tax=Sphingobacterium composti TaxID=363260 RepID=UPI00135B4C8C|nr:glycosyltransferase [Sphingobacterium composti Ten et al. 2007 non Yoo et al. 2007]
MKSPDEPIMVSIFCITYNHSKFITKAIEGFLMQQCNFNIEIIIGDDCSNDGTTQIIDEYAAKYPHIKRLIAPHNLGPTQNMIRVALAAKGKYVATCDGDDYWTDPLKLQKQIDFLENNPEYVICTHYTRKVNADDTEVTYLNFNPKPLSYSFNDLIINKQDHTSTVSLIYRNIEEVRNIYSQDWFMKVNACDKFLKLYSTWVTGKKIYVLPETMSCYRRHVGGIWSLIPYISLRRKQISDFNLLIKVFSYTPTQKARLLRFYLKRYFMFDLKYSKLSNALTTIKAIIN